MAHIILNTGDVVLVDDEDYPLLSRFEWQRAGNAGYAVTTLQTLNGRNVTIYMHKLIMGGFWIIDHINLDPLDNRKCNLRRATKNENEWNKPKQKTWRGKPCTSQYKGVCYDWRVNKFKASIKRNGAAFTRHDSCSHLASRGYVAQRVQQASASSGKRICLKLI
jgi:hypothetical protein